jgi:glucose/arabinose dehydrogenase
MIPPTRIKMCLIHQVTITCSDVNYVRDGMSMTAISLNFKACTVFRLLCLNIGFVVLIIGHTCTTHAELPETLNKEGQNVSYFGCEHSGNATVRCDPLSKKSEGYEIAGTSSKIYEVVGQPDFSQGVISKALHMNAAYLESVKIANNAILNPRQFSVSFWIYGSPEYENKYAHIISHSNPYTKQGWHFDLSNTNTTKVPGEAVSFSIYGSTGKLYTSAPVPLPGNKFSHIAVTFDGTSIQIFKDGTLYGTTDFKDGYMADPNVPFKIGAGAHCMTCNMWTGTIDDLRIYNESLDQNEIKNIFLNKSTSIGSNNLVAHWTFDDTLNDISRYNNDGTEVTLVGGMTFAPDGRLFFTEKNTGKIKIMKDNQVYKTPFAIIPDYYVNWEQGLLGITVDPNFTQNHFIYLYYTSFDNKLGAPFNRVVRYTDNDNKAENQVVLIDKIPASKGFHSGGALAFGKDDKLYITVGDMASDIPYQQEPSSLLGKILRINRDGTIPADNPYPKSPVYNIGHRNMFGIAFDNAGFGMVTENGANLYDEINSIVKGGNYGFPTFQMSNQAPELSNSSSSIKPLRSYRSVIAPTSAIYYDGEKIPQLRNKFLFGTVTGNIYSLNIDKSANQIREEKILLKVYEDVIALAQSPSGQIYYGGFGIYELKSVNVNNKSEVLTPVEVNLSPGLYNLEYFHLFPDKKKLLMAIDPIKSINTQTSDSSSLTIRIPRQLMDGILSVSVIDPDEEEERSLSRGSDFTVNTSAFDQISVNITTPNIPESEMQQPKKVNITTPNIPESEMQQPKKVNITTPNIPESEMQQPKKVTADTTRPSLTITNPPYPATLISPPSNKTITVRGTAFDSETGIQKVEAFVHRYPFEINLPFQMATPVAIGNWSKWSIPLDINIIGYNRILARVTDNAGNENWDEITINILGQKIKTSTSEQQEPRIAFVQPTFTDTAYAGNDNNSFYNFYYKYHQTSDGINVTTDLNLLSKIKMLPDPGLAVDAHSELNTKIDAFDADVKNYMIPIIEHVKQFSGNNSIALIRDEDIHDGHIFADDGSNVYNLIFLLHNEYVTQEEYDNFKKFVSNGGTIVLINSNIFYAEVLYDKAEDTITLVKGHDWEFDGKAARKSVSERWENESKEWIGSNYMVNDISDKVHFTNNPFNYTHFEENYITNPNASVIIDYGATFPEEYYLSHDSKHRDATIATYYINYNKGKVIMVGLYGQQIANNKAFLEFFDNVIMHHALLLEDQKKLP